MAIGLVALIPRPVTAAIVNLTGTAIDGNPVSTNLGVRGGFIGDAFFKFAIDGVDPEKAGSGDFRRLYAVKDGSGSDDAENGYNRNRVFDSSVPGGFDPFVTVSELPLSADGNYYVFALDINESVQKYLSLDDVRVYTRAPPDPSPLPSTLAALSNLGALRYEMNPGGTQSHVLMDYSLHSGSGDLDLYMFLKTSLFTGAAAGDYVYLYTSFGQYSFMGPDRTDFSSDNGFEEWAVPIKLDGQVTTAPEPGAAAVLLAGAVVGSALLGRRHSQRGPWARVLIGPRFGATGRWDSTPRVPPAIFPE